MVLAHIPVDGNFRLKNCILFQIFTFFTNFVPFFGIYLAKFYEIKWKKVVYHRLKQLPPFENGLIFILQFERKLMLSIHAPHQKNAFPMIQSTNTTKVQNLALPFSAYIDLGCFGQYTYFIVTVGSPCIGTENHPQKQRIWKKWI